MKKLLALLLAVMMFAPALSLAEGLDDLGGGLEDLGGVIGGADGPTSISVTTAVHSDANLAEAALAAGHRIDTVLTLTDLTGVQTGDPTVDAAIADMIDALALRFSQQGDEGEMALLLSGQEVLNIGAALNGADCYLSSNLLGGTIVVAGDEVESLLGRLMDMFVLMGAMTDSDAAEIKAVLAEAMASVEQSMATLPTAEVELNLTALENMFADLVAKVVEVENPVVPKMCDPAVSGVQLTLNNEEFLNVVCAWLQFVDDNPMLKDYLMATSGVSVDGALASLEGEQALNGEMVVAFYLDEEDLPVYAVLTLPMAEGEETTLLEVSYTRQTVSAGVAHVVNMTVDGETATIDALETAESTVINVIAADGVKVLDVTILNAGENQLDVALNAYDGEETVFAGHLAGEWEYTDVREYFAGVLTLTPYEYGQAMPIVLRVTSDYAVDGVDFTGVGGLSVEVMGIGFGMQFASQTADAEESIMAGQVTRPAELDDATFQNWFVNVVNQLSVTLTTMLTALPESVMTLLLMSGM